MALDLSEYKNINLAAFLIHQGYSDRTPWAKAKKSRNYLAFENIAYNEKLIVKENLFVEVNSSTNKYKDIIQFVEDRLNTQYSAFDNEKSKFYSAIKILDKYLSNPDTNKTSYVKPAKSYFDLDHFIIADKLPKNSYLHSIGLTDDVIHHPIFKNKILLVNNPIYENGKFVKNNLYGNISFPYIKDLTNKIVGFEQRATNFKGHSINSNRKEGVWISNKLDTTTHILITESAKDSLGHFAKYKSDNVMYCSIGGNLTREQIQTINQIAKEYDLIKVLGFDNDIAGSTFTLQYILNELNLNNTLHSHIAEGRKELHFKLVSSNDLVTQLNDFLKKLNLDIKSPNINDGILNFILPESQENIIQLTYHLLKSNAQIFKGKYLIQRPVEKDFFDVYIKDKNLHNKIIQSKI